MKRNERHGFPKPFSTRLGKLVSLSLLSASTLAAGKEPPRLVLQITVDQLRGDLPARYLDRMGEGGFRYLLNEGVV